MFITPKNNEIRLNFPFMWYISQYFEGLYQVFTKIIGMGKNFRIHQVNYILDFIDELLIIEV